MNIGHENANMRIVLTEKAIREACGKAYDDLIDFFKEHDLTFNDVARSYEYCEMICQDSETEDLLEEVTNKVIDKLSIETGVQVYLGYHDPNEGSLNDDIQGGFFYVNHDSIYQRRAFAADLDVEWKYYVN